MSSFEVAVCEVVAGTCAGTASIAVCHPLDTVRTRLQCEVGSQSFLQCGRSLIGKEGFWGVYRGFLWPALAQGFYKAIMFGVYGFCKRRCGPEPTTLELAFCGGLAGGANALCLTPVELVRNRQQVGCDLSGLEIWRAAYRENGVRGVYRGFGATLLRDVPGVGVYYLTFEVAKRRLFPKKERLDLWQLALAGALGGAAFWTVALPFDHLKSNVQVSKDIKTLSLSRLYVGYGSALLRGIPGAAVVFVVYDRTFEHLRTSFLQREHKRH